MSTRVLREGFLTQLKRELRATGLVATGLVIICFPLWTIFDSVFAPERTQEFLALRLFGSLPALVCLPLLRWHRWGKSHPEIMVFTTLVVPELCIAYMLPRVGDALPVYLLGYTIIIYLATLLLWRFSWMAAMVGVTMSAPLVSLALANQLTTGNLVLLLFDLGTTGLICICFTFAHFKCRFREFKIKRELIEERNTTHQLLDKLEYQSTHDELTDLANRRFWREELARGWESQASLSVAMIDIDFFKSINDGCGHHLGDEVLVSIARLLKSVTGEQNLAARLGGDEMAILFRSEDYSEVELAGYELLDHVRQLRFEGSSDLRVTVSIGIAEQCAAMSDSSELVQLADSRLYRAKESRDCVVLNDISSKLQAPALPIAEATSCSIFDSNMK